MQGKLACIAGVREQQQATWSAMMPHESTARIAAYKVTDRRAPQIIASRQKVISTRMLFNFIRSCLRMHVHNVAVD